MEPLVVTIVAEGPEMLHDLLKIIQRTSSSLVLIPLASLDVIIFQHLIAF